MKRKQIDWEKGVATYIIFIPIVILIVFLLFFFLTFTNIYLGKAFAVTRVDAIADSVAVYSQSYDYNYNKSQADTMNSLLTTMNNSTSSFYDLSTTISFDADNVLAVKSTVHVPSFLPGLLGTDDIYTHATAKVKSVDIWGDILVVPDELSTNSHQAPSLPITGNGADIIS